MVFIAVLGETLVGGNEHPPLALRERPKLIVEHPLALGAPDVENVVSQRPEFVDGDVRDVLVHQNPH